MLRIAVAVLAVMLIMPVEQAFATKYGAKLCQHSSYYDCYKVKRGDSWNKLWPDPYYRDIVKRVNRTNMRLKVGSLIAVPKNLDRSHYMDYAPFSHHIGPQDSKTIVVDPTQLAYGAYDETGRLVHWGPVSGGKGYCPDVGRRCVTSAGTFKVYRKGGPSCRSSKYPIGRGGAPMFYCMFYNGGYALHASNEVPGHNASHGCVRMFLEDARWLNREFVNMPSEGGTKVIIENTSGPSLRI